MINKHLEDELTYKKLASNNDHNVHERLVKLVKKYRDNFTQKELDCLCTSNFKTSQFYGLPKIHKSKIINREIENQNNEIISSSQPNDLTVRPIVAGTNCPTKQLSDLLDKTLKPLLQHVKSYIKDNIDFLTKCKRDINHNTLIVTSDVCSLYTSIPHDLGIEAIRYYINKYQESLDKRFNKQFILDATAFVLKNNTFTFNNTNYIQLIGTAMGTIFAPTYATLVLGYLEEKLYDLIESLYDTKTKIYIEKNWDRFLDDCHILLDKNIIDPNDLHKLLNSLHPSIKFTMEVNENKLPFLDILINKENNHIWMDIYSKPTDSKRYVPFDSCHPKHCLKNIPFCLARRICMIVEKTDIKEQRLKELETLLKKQRYPQNIIKTGLEKARSLEQSDLRKSKTKSSEKTLAFITTHNPNNPNIFPMIKSSLQQLNSVPYLKNELNNINLINSKRQPPNLERMLCNTEYIDEDQLGVKKCGKNCVCCPYLLETKTYKFKYEPKPFNIKSPFTCTSSNVIYAIICSGCNEEYIGQTRRALKERLTLYKQHINHPNLQQTPVEGHLRDCGNGTFNMFPILQIRKDDDKTRDLMELKLINKFKTKLNKRR